MKKNILQVQKGWNPVLHPHDTISSEFISKMEPNKTYWVEVHDKNPEDRSIPQNNISHLWYPAIGRATGETPQQVKCRCKLDYGIPLLCEQDPVFGRFWQSVRENYPERKKQLWMMIDVIKVTSKLKKKAMHEYLDTVRRTHAEQGIALEGV